MILIKLFNLIYNFIIRLYYEIIIFFYMIFQLIVSPFYWFLSNKNIFDECAPKMSELERKKRKYHYYGKRK